MKILWHSNAPYVGTGYGNQTSVFLNLIEKAGHEMVVSAFFGHRGAILSVGDTPLYPGGLDEWGNDILPAHYRRHAPDVVVALMDVWVIDPAVSRQMPLTSWCPIDHSPMPPRVHEHLEPVTWIWAMSRYGERQLQDAGFKQTVYVPHGIDTEIFSPVDQSTARKRWNIPDDVFTVVVNAANKGVPSRKSFEAIIKAWARFSREHSNSLLYLHTLPVSATYGHELSELLLFYDVDPSTIRFPDTYNYVVGNYGQPALRDLYVAADVLLSPSMGEGFGLPVVEAQASGCPVIVTDFSAQTELCFGGYLIDVDPFDDYIWTPQGAEQAFIQPSMIVNALEWALENRGNQKLRDQAREGAMEYDAQHVFDTYMLPSFEYMAELNKNFVPDENRGASVIYG